MVFLCSVLIFRSSNSGTIDNVLVTPPVTIIGYVALISRIVELGIVIHSSPDPFHTENWFEGLHWKKFVAMIAPQNVPLPRVVPARLLFVPSPIVKLRIL
uniref:Uncharacterized protein n=1 Tax=viral metagenome TaxID=1070528 RepID=A0A6M3K1C9_9ZZZZ